VRKLEPLEKKWGLRGPFDFGPTMQIQVKNKK